MNFFYAALIIPVYYSSFLFRALRWKTILLQSGNSTDKIKLPSFLSSIFKGWTISCFVPARGGELYRVHSFGKKENISRITLLASIVLERIFDGFILFLILLLLSAFVYSSEKFFKVSVIAGIVFISAFSCLLLISKFYKNTFIQEKCSYLILKIKEKNFIKNSLNKKICEILSKVFNKITGATISFMNGLELFNSPVLILKVLLFTIPVWLCEGLSLFLMIKGFGYSIGFLGALFVLSIIAFVSLIPGGPASLGPLQWGYIIALGFFNISRETAFAISIIYQLFATILISLGGLFFITTENLNLQKEKILEN